MSDESSTPRTYRIALKRGEDELEIAGPDAQWVDDRLTEMKDWLGGAAGSGGGRLSKIPQPAGAGEKPPSLAEHVLTVAPTGGLEHVLAVGYWLERHSGLQGGFRRRDLAEAFAVLRYRHSNPGVPIASARRRGLLMDGDEHEKLRLTESAERWVEDRLG